MQKSYGFWFIIVKWRWIMDEKFIRTEMLLGEGNMEKLKAAKVMIFGVGGVGSFTAEALARSGVGKLGLVDFDEIAVSNINRQIHSNTKTVGQLKVQAMKERIMDINPEAEVEDFPVLYNSENAEKLLGGEIDYIVDAIDMVSSKIDLIERAVAKGIPVISAMGAGNKLNPTMLEVSDLYKTSVCPLARVMRSELKKRGIKKLKVVYSKEQPITPAALEENRPGKRQTPGSVSFVPSVSGLIIASEVVKDIISEEIR